MAEVATQTKEYIEPPLSFTPRAVEALREVLAKEERLTEGRALRVGVVGGGCSGMSYLLTIDDLTDKDQFFLVGEAGNQVEVAMDKRHMLYLMNMNVDFEDGLNARGFTFNNPNATETCGCGQSFAV